MDRGSGIVLCINAEKNDQDQSQDSDGDEGYIQEVQMGTVVTGIDAKQQGEDKRDEHRSSFR